jgi:hypothetical protein
MEQPPLRRAALSGGPPPPEAPTPEWGRRWGAVAGMEPGIRTGWLDWAVGHESSRSLRRKLRQELSRGLVGWLANGVAGSQQTVRL